MTVARVYLNKLTADAYCKCFEAIFRAASSATTKFAVGQSLLGIITDWSDHQFAGLEKAVGKDVAGSVVKGCQVHASYRIIQALIIRLLTQVLVYL